MGQKVHPTGFRLGNVFNWKSRWFADKNTYKKHVLCDYHLRKYVQDKVGNAGIVEIILERSLSALKVTLVVSRPGVVIGRGGKNLEEIKKGREKGLKKHDKENKTKVELSVEEFKNPDISAKLNVERIADQLSKRYPHRRAVSQALDRVMDAGAKGVKIVLSGRIGGSEIGRTEQYDRGSVPRQTIRAHIDYFEQPSLTKSGYVGIKCWIYKGEEKI